MMNTQKQIDALIRASTTRVPVDQAPAGPALDAVVAEVAGKQVKWMEAIIERPTWPAYLAGIMSSRDTDWKEEEDWRVVPRYSTDISAAWELAEEENIMLTPADDEYGIDLNKWIAVPSGVPYLWELGDDTFEGYVENHLDQVVLAPAPLAITRAYLKAKGVEWVEVAD